MAQRSFLRQTTKSLLPPVLNAPLANSAAYTRPVAIWQAQQRPQPAQQAQCPPSSQQQQRHSSHSPLGSPPKIERKKVTLDTLRNLRRRNEPITMITAHDFPSAHVADHAGMEMILVGDSLAMVALGMEDTSEVLLDEMILHCRSVARATKSAFTVRIHLYPLISFPP